MINVFMSLYTEALHALRRSSNRTILETIKRASIIAVKGSHVGHVNTVFNMTTDHFSLWWSKLIVSETARLLDLHNAWMFHFFCVTLYFLDEARTMLWQCIYVVNCNHCSNYMEARVCRASSLVTTVPTLCGKSRVQRAEGAAVAPPTFAHHA